MKTKRKREKDFVFLAIFADVFKLQTEKTQVPRKMEAKNNGGL